MADVSTAVIGCGNPARRDDGVGSEVVRALAMRGLKKVRLLDAGTDGMAVMFAARGCRRLIVVDACRSGSAPGAVFEVPGAELEASHPPAFTLHGFRWDHALHAGRRMFGADFPAEVTVLLVEAESTDFGLGLSKMVSEAATRVVARIEELVCNRPST